MTHLTNLLKNKLLLQRNYHLQESAMDEWPFWMFEENIKIVNDITTEEEEMSQKQQDENTQTTKTVLK